MNKGEAARKALLEEANARKADNARAARAQDEKNRAPVICLGMEGNQYVFYSTCYKRIWKLTAEKLNSANMRAMAPRERWEAWLFPERVAAGDEVKRGELVEAMQERLFAESGAKTFDASCVRGRGVWPLASRGWLYNTGAGCWQISAEGGKPVPVDNVQGCHVYARGVELPFPADSPLSNEDGRALVELVAARPWVLPGAGDIMAGWVVASLLAGSMPLCPHVWINAPAGTGKSFFEGDLIGHMIDGKCSHGFLEPFALKQEGVPTEAGVRQSLNGDALPVLIDEVEAGNSEKNLRKIDDLLDLARSASYGKAPKVKGGADGTARSFPIKCSFGMFSVANSISRDSDSSRFLLINLRKPKEDTSGKAARSMLWERQEAGRALMQTPDFHSRLITRLLKLLPRITDNIAKLCKYLQALDGVDSRRAELFAVLMACRHALTSYELMSQEEQEKAAALLRAYSEQEEKESDLSRCLAVLLGHTLEVYGMGKMSVADACRVMSNLVEVEKLEAVKRAMSTAGLRWRADLNALQVHASAEKMQRIYAGTQWSNGQIAPVLTEGCERKSGSASPAGVWYQTAKVNNSPRRCVMIPAAMILPEED